MYVIGFFSIGPMIMKKYIMERVKWIKEMNILTE